MATTTSANLNANLCRQLEYWFEIKRRDKRGTTELLTTINSIEDRKIISVIALMDIEPTLLATIVGNDEWHFIHACHDYLNERFNLPEKRQSDPTVSLLEDLAKVLG